MQIESNIKNPYQYLVEVLVKAKCIFLQINVETEHSLHFSYRRAVNIVFIFILSMRN